MKNEFGPGFEYTDKKLPEDFFETMLKSITTTIKESRLSNRSNYKSDSSSELTISLSGSDESII